MFFLVEVSFLASVNTGQKGKARKGSVNKATFYFLCEVYLNAPVGSQNVFLSHHQWDSRIESDVFVLVEGITRSWGETKCFAFFLLQFSTEK